MPKRSIIKLAVQKIQQIGVNDSVIVRHAGSGFVVQEIAMTTSPAI